MFLIGRLRGARSVSSFCDFRKMTFRDLTAFPPFSREKSCVFQIFLLRSIKAYLFPNIINFDSVDFSERRPEEVISFCWRSVYLYTRDVFDRCIIVSITARYYGSKMNACRDCYKQLNGNFIEVINNLILGNPIEQQYYRYGLSMQVINDLVRNMT